MSVTPPVRFASFLPLLAAVLTWGLPGWAAERVPVPTDEVHQKHKGASPPIDFNRDISPILSRRCFECHGPDSQNRKGKLRLDAFEHATAPRKSGAPAIVAGNSAGSSLITRITSRDEEERMPPVEKGVRLTDAEIDLLRRWIAEGARYETHWAFVAPADPPLPRVIQSAWATQSLDVFVLARLEEAGLRPAPPAEPRVLIRRAYFDLIGLPPTPEQVTEFLADTSPSAFARVVDRLLGSPQYGERWGRHWLDIARYGDSNGGDENRYYPYAFRYRDYVIDAFNQDVPYDRFLQEQIAGDLLPPSPEPDEQARRLTATGFLAIGTKILAEKDPVKMRADIVDEQIDTCGKAFVGLTLGCARCHDHKFDPIPTEDYYALAGIFHSTTIEDLPLETTAYRNSMAAHQARLKRAELALSEAEKKRRDMLDEKAQIEIEAESFLRGNVSRDTNHFGKEIGIISDPGAQDNFVEYDLEVAEAASYLVEIRYAALEARPGRILLNGGEVKVKALAETTGGWMPANQRWCSEGVFAIPVGRNVLRLESKPNMAHLDKIRLTPVRSTNALREAVAYVSQQATNLGQVRADAPQPSRVMAVKDGSVGDAKIHIRGSHTSLGAQVPRGFLSKIGADERPSFHPQTSGRLELARWFSRPDHPLTSRVMVNRIWRWHFGKGIVGSPDNFGTKGERPTHVDLLNHLAWRFIQDGWSIKAMHRRILLSSTYQMASAVRNPRAEQMDLANTLYWKRDILRLEAEAFRDALLMLAGTLDLRTGGTPLKVVSGDPSPSDLEKNRKVYEESPRRAVYLPVVRSNVYDLLTLLDFPNASTPEGNRVTTTVPTQALLMMNNPFLISQARRLVNRVRSDARLEGERSRLDYLHRMLFSRPASPAELEWSLSFLEAYGAAATGIAGVKDPELAWTALCQTLLISNEFVHSW